jgi:hypothetical protein
MRFPARLLAVLTAALVGLTLCVGVPTAGASSNPTPTSTPARSAAAAADAGNEDAEDGQAVLDRAEEVLTEGEEVTPAPPADPESGDTEADPGSPVDASMALRDLFLARSSLRGDDADRAATLLARPSDGNDEFGQSYGFPSTRMCGRHVCVHYVTRSADAPPSRRWVRTNVRVMERVWRHHLRRLGYRAPRNDGRRGGDGRFDVYLKELGSQGLYGYCAPERRVRNHPRQASSYCVLDDDFARSQFGRAPRKTLRVTAAHEFFHAIQFAYDIEEDLWLLESTATWMEEVFADAVNDNRAYLPYGQVKRSWTSLDLFNPNGFEHYGNWPFWTFVTRRHGVGAVRQVFRQVGTGGLPNLSSIAGVKRVLNWAGSFTGDLSGYFAANATPTASYPEGWAWPLPRMTASRRLTPDNPVLASSVRINHLASRHVRAIPRGYGPRGRLRVAVVAPPSPGRFTAITTVLFDDGRVQRRRVPLRGGLGRIITPFTGRVRSVTTTLVNASTRYDCYEGTTYACRGESLDDRRPFSVRLTAYRRP